MAGYDAEHLVRGALRIVLVWTVRLARHGGAEGVDRAGGGPKGDGGTAVVREQTAGAVDGAGDAGRDRLVDGEGAGVAVVRRTSGRRVLVAVSMTSLGGFAIAMRHIFCVIVHDSTRDSYNSREPME